MDGRRRRLGRDAIAAAGYAVVEREGITALTLRAVAGELGTGQASLYRHITDRDDLLGLLAGRVAAGLPTITPEGDARERLVRHWVALHDHLAARPWAAELIATGTDTPEQALPVAEGIAAALLDLGLDQAEAAGGYRALWHLLLGELRTEHPLRHPGQPLDPRRYPALRALRDSGSGPGFGWAVRRLIDGLRRAGKHPAHPQGTPPSF